MHPREVENVLDNEAQGFPDPCPVVQLNHHFTFWASSHLWLQEPERRDCLLPYYAQQEKKKNTTLIYAIFFHQITVILQTSLSITSQNLSEWIWQSQSEEAL